MRTPLNNQDIHYAWSQLHREVYKSTLEMRTPPLIRILKTVPRVSGIEGFHSIRSLVILILCINTAGGTAATASITTTSVPSASKSTALTDDEDTTTTTTSAVAVNATRAELITSEY